MGERVDPEVLRVHVQVVDVEQHAAAAAPAELAEELRLGHLVAAERDVDGRVLEREPAPEPLLHARDASAHVIEHALGQCDWKEIVGLATAERGQHR
jgi:hypothetical protein